MIRAILFDLDGTLLDNDIQAFLRPYFQALTRKLSRLVTPDVLIEQILASTQKMMANTDPAKTNQQVFMEDFFPNIGHSPEELMPLFDDFYKTDFPKLRRYTRVRREARPAVQNAFDRDCTVAIATNPIFPLVAVKHRLEWANVGDFPYALITAYENMHSCKPHVEYYREIAAKLGREPEECIMVGNDPQDDIAAAANAGLKTFYADYDRNPGDGLVATDYRGSLDEFRRLLATWPNAK